MFSDYNEKVDRTTYPCPVQPIIHKFGHCDDVMMMLWWWKIKLFTKNTFLRKVTVVFFQNSHFEACSQATHIFTCVNACFLQATLSWGANFSHCTHGWATNMLLKGKNIKISNLLEGNLLEGWVGFRMVIQVLAFQISWDHSLSK